MDEMKINSSFLQYIISRIIAKVINNKFGTKISVMFTAPIVFKMDEENANLDLNLKIAAQKEDIAKLFKDLM